MAIVNGFSHLVLPVSDIERSEVFYKEVFGLECVGRNLVSEGEENTLLKSDSRQMLLLVRVPDVRIEREGANSTHHAWLVKTPAEYHAVIKRLESMDFNVNDYRAAFRTAGQYSVDLVDPDGHRWQIQAQGPEATEIRLEKSGIVNCGPAENYEIGDVKLFEDQKFFLLRMADGFLALSQWCTHMNGLVRWRDNFYDFYCPSHGAAFDRTGKACSPLMRLAPLRVHPLTISESGDVEVDTDRLILRRKVDPEQLVPPVKGAAFRTENLKDVREVR